MPLLGGETELYDFLKESSAVPVYEKENCGGAHGYYDRRNHSITILSSLPSVDKATVYLHERTHSILHQGDEGRQMDRQTKELEAESVAFIVSHAFGIDSSSTSFNYLASWAREEGYIDKIKQAGSRIQKAAQVIMDEVHAHYEKEISGEELLKEHSC